MREEIVKCWGLLCIFFFFSDLFLWALQRAKSGSVIFGFDGLAWL